MRRFCLLIVAVSLPAFAGTCESLTSLKLPDASITMATTVGAGDFSVPAGRGGPPPNFKDLPAFCRVFADADAVERFGNQSRSVAAGGCRKRRMEREV